MQNSLLVSKEEFIVGESNMEAQCGRPLALPYLAVFICLDGKAVVQVNFKKYLLKHYDILILSEDSFTLFLQTSKDFRLAYCLVDKSLASETAYKLPNRLFPYLWNFPHCVLDETEKTLLETWYRQILYINSKSKIYRRTMLCNQLQTFFLYLSEQVRPMLSDDSIKHKCSRKELLCWKFWELIGKNCKEHRDVAFYAQALYITPFYLSQITRHFMNDSTKGLIERQVILKIKSLLCASEFPVKKIADMLHFEDASYMCRFFKRHTGISLTEYREKST